MAVLTLASLVAATLQTKIRYPYAYINDPEMRGKTVAQIVQMGRSKWFDFYTSFPGGGSTVGMSIAESTFGYALQIVNDTKIAKLARSRRDQINGMRKAAFEFALECHNVGEVSSGGGTMWRNINSTIYPDIEIVVSEILAKKFTKINPKFKSFEDGIVVIRKMLQSPNDLLVDDAEGKIRKKSMFESWSKLQKQIPALQNRLKTFPTAERLRWQANLLETLYVAKGVGE